MNSKMIVSALVGSVVAFGLGWLVFEVLMHSFYMEHSVKYRGLMRNSETRIWAIYLAQLTWAGLFAYVFDRWANIRTFAAGLMGGLILSAFIFTSVDLMTWSMMNLFDYKLLIADVIVNTIIMGIVGGVVGLVLGTGKRAT